MSSSTTLYTTLRWAHRNAGMEHRKEVCVAMEKKGKEGQKPESAQIQAILPRSP